MIKLPKLKGGLYMSYMHLWVKPQEVDGVKRKLQRFCKNNNDLFEIRSEKLGGKIHLITYNKIPRIIYKNINKLSGVVSVDILK